MEASLTCAVCLSLFENPTTLPVCSHNFCKKCILECVTKSFCSGIGLGSSNNIWRNSQLECPLCRKTNFIAEGAVNLPGNTTLAEVVKLFRSQHGASGGSWQERCEELEEGPGPGSGPGAKTPGAGRATCERHPPRSLLLFCKVCKQVACGQCVSEHHRGVFHSVNLIDIIYQEEKLDYFNNLRELRQLSERLKAEVADKPSDMELILEYEKEIVMNKFDEISEKLELKRKQLLEKIEKQIESKKAERKASLARKQTQKDAVERYLKECEQLVNECNPVNFLKVACDLNERVRGNLAVVLPTLKTQNELACLQPSQFHIEPVLDSISALQLDKGTTEPNGASALPTDTGNTTGQIVADGYRFKTPLKMWKQPKDFDKPKFSPKTVFDLLDGQENRHWCLTAKSEYQDMSLEEMRYKYYQSYRKDWNCFMNESYSGDVNNANPSVSSSTSVDRLEKHGIEQHPVKLFSFVHSHKKVKNKCLVSDSNNFKFQLSNNLGTITSKPSISNTAISLSSSSTTTKLSAVEVAPSSCDLGAVITKSSVSNSQRLLTTFSSLSIEQKKQEDNPVPSTSVEAAAISDVPSVVKTLPATRVTVSCPATSAFCTALPAFDKTDEHQIFISPEFRFGSSTETVCSKSPYIQNATSNSNVNSGLVNATITSGASHTSVLPSTSAIGKATTLFITTKTENEQALLFPTTSRFNKPSESSSASSTATTLTTVFHNTAACNSSDNKRTSTITSASDSEKVYSVGTAPVFPFAKITEDCSSKSSSKSPFSLSTLGPLGDQNKAIPKSFLLGSETERYKSLFTNFPNVQISAKSNTSLGNQNSSSAADLIYARGDASDLFTPAHSKSDVSILNDKQVLSFDEGSVFKCKVPSTVTAPSSLLASSSSSLFAGSFKQAQSLTPSNQSTSSSEITSVCSMTHSAGSIPTAFTTCFSQQLSAASEQESTVNLFKMKKKVPIVTEPSKHNNIHLSDSKHEHLPPVVSEQQNIDITSTNVSFEDCKTKNTQAEKWLSCKPVLLQETKFAGSKCVGFGKELSSAVSQHQTKAATQGVGVGTWKVEVSSLSDVTVSTKQHGNDENPDPFLQPTNMTPLGDSLGKCLNNIEESRKESPVFSDQIKGVHELHSSENQGHTEVHHSPTTSSDFCAVERQSNTSDKAGLSCSPVTQITSEPLNLSSHSKNFASVPQSIASKSSSFEEANNNAKAEAQTTSSDCPLDTPAGLHNVFTFGAGIGFQFKPGCQLFASGVKESKGDCETGPKPMFPFPPPVNNPPTSITEEDILFSNQAKLYYFERTSLQWKERAFGEIRILQHKTTKLSRLVMWNSSNKCCANHWITSILKLKNPKNSNHNWTWSALDYSGKKVISLDLAIHFKLKETAQMFKEVFESVKDTERPESAQKRCSAENNALANDSKEEGNSLQEGDDNVVVLSEVTPTPEQRALALELHLPPTFFCYKNKPGYQSSDDEDENFEAAVQKLGGRLYPNQN
ncbi:serine-rich adhesin for platelets-like [Hypanus sabinus]|uniref:serine-rich adhesin for platelets-like n=1 Tax=Hypanus sabinus TaxID=79690 RepID=UPI0028C4064B|nr:serine-rich adhesin for platelets-like [Hypanus sabinus]